MEPLKDAREPSGSGRTQLEKNTGLDHVTLGKPLRHMITVWPLTTQGMFELWNLTL